MNERPENPLAWLTAAIMTLLAFSIGVQGDSASSNAIDHALPLVAFVLLGAAWIARGRFSSVIVAACVPLLLVLRLSIPDDSQRLLAYGLVLASTIVLAGSAVASGGMIGVTEALVLVLSPLAIMRLVPFELTSLVTGVVALTGTALLILASRMGSRVPVASCAIAFVAGILAPFWPMRAACSTLLFAALVWWIRTPGPVSGGSLVAASLLAGRWSWPIAMIALVARGLEHGSRRGDSVRAVVPMFLRATTAAPFRLLAAVPIVVDDVRELSREIAAGALLIGALAFAMRPGVAVLYGLAALLMLHSRTHDVRRTEVAVPLIVICAMAVALFAWSGSVHAHFPIPIDTRWVAAISAIATLPLIPRLQRAAGVIAAGAFIAIVIVVATDGRPIETQAENISLAPGESVSVNLRARSQSLTLILSGANVAQLRRGEPLGLLDLLDSDGHAWRREIHVGDVSDWGAFRPRQSFQTRNPLPVVAGATLTGVGINAFLPGSGAIVIRSSADVIAVRVTASSTLPADARLQFERIEVKR